MKKGFVLAALVAASLLPSMATAFKKMPPLFVLADAMPADRAALGFLGLSPSYWKELQLPPELFQAARIDGAGELRTLWSVALPLVRPFR